MNFQDAIKAAQSIPHVITMFGNDAGPRLKIEVTKQDRSFADLKVHARLMGRTPKSVTLYCSLSCLSIGCSVEALVEANILAEHLREQVPGAGHVVCNKDGERFAVQFALPEAPTVSNTVEALPPVTEAPAEDAATAPEKTTSKRSR